MDKFLRRYFEHVPYEDMHGRSPQIMGQAAVSHFDFGKVRKPGKALLRIFRQIGEDGSQALSR